MGYNFATSWLGQKNLLRLIARYFVISFLIFHFTSLAFGGNQLIKKQLIKQNSKEYLIITRSIFSDALAPLVTAKESKGLSVNLITLIEIENIYPGRDVQEKIRNCIKDRFQNNNTNWVLLVGSPDADDNPASSNSVSQTQIDKTWEMPVRYIYCPTDNYTFVPSEMYYSCLDGDWDLDNDNIFGERASDCEIGLDEVDWLPDVNIGRIPATSPEQVETYIKKLLSIDYSSLDISQLKALQIHCKIENELADGSISGLVLANLPENEKPTKEKIDHELNNGDYKILTITGHANTTSWSVADGGWTGAGLSDGGSIFFCYASACLSSYIDYSNTVPTITENLLFKPACGAIGYVGAWRLSTPHGQNDLWREFWRRFFDGTITQPGETLSRAERAYFFSYAYWYNITYKYWHYTQLIYSLFGDPELKIGQVYNNGPDIVSIPSVLAPYNEKYHYDDDNQADVLGTGQIKWEKVSGPDYFNIGEDGLISWIPDREDPVGGGRPEIVIKATDDFGSTEQRWEVQCGQRGEICSNPRIYTVLGSSYQYDEDGKAEVTHWSDPRWKIIEAPKGFIIDPNTGSISWMPELTGEFEIILQATDQSYNLDFQRFVVTVGTDPVPPPPISNFDANETFGVKPFNVQFNDNSMGEFTTLYWDFGDGQSSTEQNPLHTYETADTFTVSLQVTGPGGSDTKTREKYITVLSVPPPDANFTVDQRYGLKPYTVQFTDKSTGHITNWQWDFGDGQSSTEQNPFHTYEIADTFDVTLKVTSLTGSDTKTNKNFIVVLNEWPEDTTIAHWTFNEMKGDTLFDKSGNKISGIIHGAHWTSAEGINALQFDGIDDTVSINDCENLHNSTIILEAIVFLNSSSSGIVNKRERSSPTWDCSYSLYVSNSYLHAFVMTESKTWARLRSSEKIPLEQWNHVALTYDGDSLRLYTNYKIVDSSKLSGKLRRSSKSLLLGFSYDLSNSYFLDGYISEIRISKYTPDPNYFLLISSPPIANFSANKTYGAKPLTVRFFDNSLRKITNWQWDFGDGQSSMEQNPFHTYVTADTFSVSLAVSGPSGSSTKTREKYITVLSGLPPDANFTANQRYGLRPFTVKFTDKSAGHITSWQWDFGDGQSSTEQNPSHTYETADSFSVSLTVTGPEGSDTKSIENFIVVVNEWPNGTDINSNSVSGIWTKLGSPYSVFCDISVPSGQSLLIEPSVEVKFMGKYGLTVGENSQLKAIGNASDSIKFYAANPTEGWFGIDFIYSGDDDTLAFCSIANGYCCESTSNINNRGGVVYIYRCSPVIKNCIFKNNVGIMGGGILMRDECASEITNCVFANNEATNGAAAQIQGSTPIFKNILVYDNSSKRGGAFYINNSRVKFQNTTIAENKANSKGGIFYLSYRCMVEVDNSILWGNEAPNGALVALGTSEQNPDTLRFSFSDIDTTTNGWDYYNIGGNGSIIWDDSNIVKSPDFISIESNNFILSEFSPCIDAGNPDPILNDPENSANPGYALWPALGTVRNDMGVFGGPGSTGWPINRAPLTFSLISPPDGDTLSTFTPTFKWFRSIDPDSDDDVCYELNIDTDQSFSSPLIIYGLTDTTYTYADSLAHFTTYFWKVKAYDKDNLTTISSEIFHFTLNPFTEVSKFELKINPIVFSLSQNYPNPFNPSTTIKFALPKAVDVKITIFNALGQKTAVLLNESMPVGYHEIEFNAQDLPSGVYVYKIEAGQFKDMKKMLFLK